VLNPAAEPAFHLAVREAPRAELAGLWWIRSSHGLSTNVSDVTSRQPPERDPAERCKRGR
jgi:hypothetical protein